MPLVEGLERVKCQEESTTRQEGTSGHAHKLGGEEKSRKTAFDICQRKKISGEGAGVGTLWWGSLSVIRKSQVQIQPSHGPGKKNTCDAICWIGPKGGKYCPNPQI